MSYIDNIKEKAKLNKMRIVLPESMDKRVLDAARVVLQEDIADIILIGSKENIDLTGLEKATIIDPSTSELTEELINELYELRRTRCMTVEEARRLLLEDYMYFATMLLKTDRADGVVSGACHSTANTLRPALQIIKTSEGTELASGFFLMEVPNCQYGSNGVFIFADCGLIQNPTVDELVEIAGESAKSFELLVGEEARVAMLSHSTKGSASHDDVNKVVEAVVKAKDRYSFKIDGELQLDAAIIPEIAMSKDPNGELKGTANVLIFPDLDAGNIGYKLVERLGKANAYGPLVQGLNKPINDLSRGCSASDIVGVIAITAVQAQNEQ